ncbi:FAD-dependent monooxygenase [Streptomyces cylindrosporus]|uniref:FAD-dependent monooxygenase n=1 Tax=Streptomyces cylindrosporus TaxID=2927583 RepID=A0ABS9YKG5_9ACTN|nr:FAD-dependent monooxygenase [Streptomyces cylindrosporus]MCI3277713.1 FAD-dependent monooxygenase [Streptomyces cylindrosporus]
MTKTPSTNNTQSTNTQGTTNARSLAHLNVLISGASVAGPALALNLLRYGARVTVVEKAPELRGGGFAVDFRGHVHRRVLTDMGIWDDIHARQTHMGRQTVVDADGSPKVDLPSEMMSGDVEIFRGELARIMYERTRDRVEYVFGDSIATLTDTGDGVDVTFEKGPARRFDLVVGADGLHSHTRRLAFGDESRYLRFFDHYVAGFEVPNHLGLDRTGRVYSEPGRAIVIANYDGDPERSHALLCFRSEQLSYDRRDLTAQKRILMERFAGMGWEVPAALKALEETDDLYFDAIAQIHVDRLTKGRVALLGDAGYGATMGGMGTGVAVVGSYVLAGELALAGGDHRTAFAAYEARITDFAKGCQKTSGNAGPFFAPPTERRIRSRDRMYRLLASRPLAAFFKKITVKAATAIKLPEYPA